MIKHEYAVYLKEQYIVYAESEQAAIDKVVAGEADSTDYFEVVGVSELVDPGHEGSESQGLLGTERASGPVEPEDPGF